MTIYAFSMMPGRQTQTIIARIQHIEHIHKRKSNIFSNRVEKMFCLLLNITISI